MTTESNPLSPERLQIARNFIACPILPIRFSGEYATISAALTLADEVNRGEWVQSSARTVNLTEQARKAAAYDAMMTNSIAGKVVRDQDGELGIYGANIPTEWEDRRVRIVPLNEDEPKQREE